MTRKKTIVVEGKLDRRIAELVEASRQNGIDIDYNVAINLLAELGERSLGESTRMKREEQREVLSKYLDYDKFEESVIADWKELEEFRKWKLLRDSQKKQGAG